MGSNSETRLDLNHYLEELSNSSQESNIWQDAYFLQIEPDVIKAGTWSELVESQNDQLLVKVDPSNHRCDLTWRENQKDQLFSFSLPADTTPRAVADFLKLKLSEMNLIDPEVDPNSLLLLHLAEILKVMDQKKDEILDAINYQIKSTESYELEEHCQKKVEKYFIEQLPKESQKLKVELEGYIRKKDLVGFVRDQDLHGVVREKDLAGFVREQDLHGIVREKDLAGFVREQDLHGMVREKDLQNHFRHAIGNEIENTVELIRSDLITRVEDLIVSKIEDYTIDYRKQGKHLEEQLITVSNELKRLALILHLRT